MIKKAVRALTSVVMLYLTACASIVSQSQWPVKLDTNPSGANCVVSDNEGVQIHSGHSPMLVTLKSGHGYFSSAKYHISCTKPGFNDTKTLVQAHLNGWYWGNILFGGVIGLFIVDPATGAMWKFGDSQIVQLETPHQVALDNPNPQDTVPDDGRSLLLQKEDTLAVLPFTINATQANYNHLSQGFSDDMTYYLLKNQGLTVLDRNTVDKALSEITFTNSGVADADKTQNIGKILGAKFLVLGNVDIIGDEVSIVCRVVKVETCENVISEKVSGSANDLFALREQLGKRMNSRLSSNGG